MNQPANALLSMYSSENEGEGRSDDDINDARTGKRKQPDHDDDSNAFIGPAEINGQAKKSLIEMSRAGLMQRFVISSDSMNKEQGIDSMASSSSSSDDDIGAIPHLLSMYASEGESVCSDDGAKLEKLDMGVSDQECLSLLPEAHSVESVSGVSRSLEEAQESLSDTVLLYLLNMVNSESLPDQMALRSRLLSVSGISEMSSVEGIQCLTELVDRLLIGHGTNKDLADIRDEVSQWGLCFLGFCSLLAQDPSAPQPRRR